MIDLSQFHFLRPFWLLALLPLAWLVWSLARRRFGSRGWASVCDPTLLPHVLVGGGTERERRPALLVGVAGVLAILALAGPAWSKLPQPVFSSKSGLVIVLDMNKTMNANDVKPSRLIRARYKIDDILRKRKEGLTALVVYSGDAFTVSPLTEDTATIESQLSALTTNIMPASGNRPDLGLKRAVKLLRQAGVGYGQVLLIADNVDGKDGLKAARAARAAGYRVSVMGVGTRLGAPVRQADGSYLKDGKGQIVISILKQQPMRELAAAGGGDYVRLTLNDSDLRKLAGDFKADRLADQEVATHLHTDTWREEGPWLLLALLPLCALAFRRGYLLVLVLLLVPLPRAAHAFDWNDLWLRPDQQAKHALDHGDAARAAKLFRDPSWKGVAQYRAGHYGAAAKALQHTSDAEDLYNLGNALAREGRYRQAIAAYDKALKKDPDHADAKYNRHVVEEALKKRQKQQQKQSRKSHSGKQGKQQQKAGGKSADNQKRQGKDGKSDKNEQQSGSRQANANRHKAGQNKEQQAQSGKQKKKNVQNNRTAKAGKQPQEQARPGGKHQQQPQTETARKQGARQNQSLAQEDSRQTEQQQADEQWLRRIPDDPGGLLRRKFLYEYEMRHGHAPQGDNSW